MFLAQVTGNVVATQKLEKMVGKKLLVVEPLRVDEASRDHLRGTGRTLIAVDALGAGPGQVVLICQGSSARLTAETSELPVDTVVIGIVDSVGVGDQSVFGAGRKTKR